jgi:hypothetical protein
MRFRAAFAFAAGIALSALTLAGCSKSEGPTIIGHWRAERVQLLSAHLPIGPDFVVGEHELVSPDAEVRIPIAGIEAKRNEAIVDFAYGLGLSFYFDGPDRMYVEVPLAGKLYYRRVNDAENSVSASQPTAPVHAITSPPPIPTATDRVDATVTKQSVEPAVSSSVEPAYKLALTQGERSINLGQLDTAEALLAKASEVPAAHPAVDYDLAVLKIRQSDPDSAIRHLGDAFAKGFRGFDVIDRDRTFDPLKTDVRFTALVSRYR